MPVCYLAVISGLRSLFASLLSDFWLHIMQSYLESAVSYDTFRLAGWQRVLSMVGAGFDGGPPRRLRGRRAMPRQYRPRRGVNRGGETGGAQLLPDGVA